jgi:hypothetical protein
MKGQEHNGAHEMVVLHLVEIMGESFALYYVKLVIFVGVDFATPFFGGYIG